MASVVAQEGHRAAGPTPAQERVLEAVQLFRFDRGYGPSVRELAFMLGLSSPATVQRHLGELERKGLVRREPGLARTLRVL